MYQANYGFTATGQHDPNVNNTADDEKKQENVKDTKSSGFSSFFWCSK